MTTILEQLTNIANRLIQRCCGNAGTGISLETEEQPEFGVEFGSPPPSWEPTIEEHGTDTYYNRKCAQANQIVDGMEYIFDFFDTNLVPQIYAFGVGFVVAAIVTVLTFPLSGPFSVIIGIAAGAGTLATVLIAGSWDASVLRTIAQNSREELVCAMFEAASAESANIAIIDIFETEGANVQESNIVSLLLSLSGATNNLFYFRDDIPPPPEDYATDCGGCGGTCPELVVTLGEVISGDLDVPGAVTIESRTYDFGPGEREYIQVRSSPSCTCQHLQFKITAITLPGSEDGSGVQVCNGTWIYNHDLPPLEQVTEGYLVQVLRTTGAGRAEITIDLLGWV